MLKYVSLVTGLTSDIFSVAIFLIIPPISETIILLRANLASKSINNALFITVKLMIYLVGLIINQSDNSSDSVILLHT